MSASSAAAGALRPGRALQAALGLALLATLALGTVQNVAATGTDPGRPDIVDFHPFHISGRLALAGRFTESYDAPRMAALQRAEGGGRDVSMPFVYPPMAGLMFAPLAVLPLGAAYLLFAGGSLALYLAVLRRLAGPWFPLMVLVSAPAAVVGLRIGQNGLLTGALAGLSALAALRGRPAAAGAFAGLLAVKPQLAAGLGLLFALRRDGRAAAAAVAVAVLLAGAALAAFGSGAFAGFRAAAAGLGALMVPGVFPLHRLVSAYGLAASLGAPPLAAMLLHALVAAAVLAAAGLACHGRAAAPEAAGLCLMSTAFVSPYLFDYDLPVFCAGLALALPALAAAMGPRRLGALLAGAALGQSFGLLFSALDGVLPGPAPSLGCPALLACFAAAAAALRGPAPRAALAPALP